MAKRRKFYITKITLVVLSEDAPPEWDNLHDLSYLIDEGPCVGHMTDDVSKRISGKQMAKELIKAGSDPGFFQLDEKGKTTDKL